jgi:hypothetical protein
MTTHQLAHLLDHLLQGFGDSLKSGTGFPEVIATFRELPDQPLKELVKNLRKATASPSSGAAGSGPALIEHIRAVHAGATDGPPPIDPNKLTAPQLKDVLRAFQQPVSGTKAALVARVRQLMASPATSNDSPPPPVSEFDPAAVEEGVRVYSELRDNPTLSLAEVRARFERLRNYPKPVVEEITRRLQYTPHGSRSEMLDRLLANLESLKMSQQRMQQILAGQ